MRATKYYAALRNNTVYGVGTTKNDAMFNAGRYVTSNLDVVIVPCTERAARAFNEGRDSDLLISMSGVMMRGVDK